MYRRWHRLSFLVILGLFFGIGYFLASFWSDFSDVEEARKPVIEMREKNNLIGEDTQVIYEEVYTKCGHVIISEFPERDSLNGKTLEDIRNIYSAEKGYEVKKDDESLIIRRTVDAYCPAEYEKRRLKEYKGYIAIFRGPDEEEFLEKVTNIKIENLPLEEQVKIKRGDYEFKDETVLNDALENFDEYI